MSLIRIARPISYRLPLIGRTVPSIKAHRSLGSETGTPYFRLLSSSATHAREIRRHTDNTPVLSLKASPSPSPDWRLLHREASSRQSALPITRQVHTACRKACKCEAQRCCSPSRVLPWNKKPAFIFWSIVFSILLVGASPMIAFLFTVATLAPFILLIIGFTLALVLLSKMNGLALLRNIESSNPSLEPQQDKTDGKSKSP